MADLVSVSVVDPHALLGQEASLTQDTEKAADWVTIKSPEASPQVIPKRRPVVTPPAKKKAKQALDTPLSEFERPRSVAKGKQVARQVVQKWLDF